MSTYYSFYMFLRNPKNKKLIYCGPYNAKGKIAPIYGISGSFTYGLLNDCTYINEDYFEDYGLETYFNKTNEEYFKNSVKLLNMDDLSYIKDDIYVQCYVRRDIIRNLEFSSNTQEDFNPLEYDYYSEDEDKNPPVISQSEYNNLMLENKQNYIFYPFKNYESPARHKNDLLTIAYNWFNENIYYHEEFKDYTTDDLVFVVEF